MRTVLIDAPGGRLGNEALGAVVDCLARGEPVGLPTETVYGLAAPALDARACAKLFEAKERPLSDPLICHLPGVDWLDRMGVATGAAARLAEAFWPGPLTLVIPKTELVPEIVTAGSPKVALRMSSHPLFRQVIEAFGRPLAAPSANRFGRISPTCAADVIEELGGRIAMVADGGRCAHGIESTIVEVMGDGLRILRRGPVGEKELAAFGAVESAGGERTAAPGQMPSHYAPGTPLRLLDRGEPECGAGRRGLLAWRGDTPGDWAAVERLSESLDLREAAANLYCALRRLDRLGLDALFAEPLPETGLGAAIMERLRKAAARG